MNILFLSRDYPPNLIGGVGVYTLEMSRQLARAGHNVFVITAAGEFECEYIDKGVKVFRVKPKRFKIFNPIRNRIGRFLSIVEYSIAVSKKIKEVLKRYKIEVIESCEARMEGFWYYLFNKKPALVIKLHTPESIVYTLDNIRRNLDLMLIEFLENWWIERADRIVGITDSVISLTRKRFNISRNHFPKVPNPVQIDYFKPEKDSSLIQKNVLYVGRLEFRKGIHILMKAIPIILRKVPDAKFILVGSDCGMKDYVLRKIQSYNCKGSVELKGKVLRETTVFYYRNSSVCVIPSLWENYPYVCLEAMACARPVIASRCGGLPEIIKDGVNGFLFTPGSYLELAEKIIRVLNSDSLQQEIGLNARKFMEANYNPQKVTKETINVYSSLTRDKRL